MPAAVGFSCRVCGIRQVAAPHAIKATYKLFQDHLKAYHSDAKTNLDGQQIAKLTNEIGSKLLYSPEEVQAFMAGSDKT